MTAALVWERVTGVEVVSWSGTHMAFTGGDDLPGAFDRPDCPFLQLHHLNAVLTDGTVLQVGTAQYDDGFGLWLTRCGAVEPSDGLDGYFLNRKPYSIYRWQETLELPSGPIEAVHCHVGGDLVAEVLLTVGQSQLLLVAGEVEEARSGSITYRWCDESVLAFRDPSDADRLRWTPPRQPGP